MKKLYQKLALLSLPLAINSCDDSKSSTQATPTPTKYSFDKFGNIGSFQDSFATAIAISTGDFDGDGDIDIVGLDKSSTIYLYENKIPQHNQTTKTLEAYRK